MLTKAMNQQLGITVYKKKIINNDDVEGYDNHYLDYCRSTHQFNHHYHTFQQGI